MGDRVVPRAEDGLAPDRHLEAAGVAVRQWGADDARPFVFGHGLGPLGPWVVDDAAPVWAERHALRVLAPDLPGFGETPAREADVHRPSRLAALLLELLDALALERPVYAGWSWGATIGVHLAAAAPGRLAGLVLLDAGFEDYDLPASLEQARAEDEEWRFESYDAFLEAARAEMRPLYERGYRRALVERDGVLRPRVAPETIAAGRAGVNAEPPTARLAELGASGLPVLLLVRGDAPEDAVERFRAAVPQAEVRGIEGAGHNLLADAPARVAEEVGTWAASR